jgi:hypothetical protein
MHLDLAPFLLACIETLPEIRNYVVFVGPLPFAFLPQFLKPQPQGSRASGAKRVRPRGPAHRPLADAEHREAMRRYAEEAAPNLWTDEGRIGS